jgi:hypothetical protein
VGRVVLASCDAFDNFPPGLTGKTLVLTGKLSPRMFGLFMQQMRLRGYPTAPDRVRMADHAEPRTGRRRCQASTETCRHQPRHRQPSTEPRQGSPGTGHGAGGAGGTRTHDPGIMRNPDNGHFGLYQRL